jgi:hypothetical protein
MNQTISISKCGIAYEWRARSARPTWHSASRRMQAAKIAGRTASYRLVPLGAAWYRIIFFLRAIPHEKYEQKTCGSNLQEHYGLWCAFLRLESPP